MLGYHAATVTRCDSRIDFDACPCYGYEGAGEAVSFPHARTIPFLGRLLVEHNVVEITTLPLHGL